MKNLILCVLSLIICSIGSGCGQQQNGLEDWATVSENDALAEVEGALQSSRRPFHKQQKFYSMDELDGYVFVDMCPMCGFDPFPKESWIYDDQIKYFPNPRGNGYHGECTISTCWKTDRAVVTFETATINWSLIQGAGFQIKISYHDTCFNNGKFLPYVEMVDLNNQDYQNWQGCVKSGADCFPDLNKTIGLPVPLWPLHNDIYFANLNPLLSDLSGRSKITLRLSGQDCGNYWHTRTVFDAEDGSSDQPPILTLIYKL